MQLIQQVYEEIRGLWRFRWQAIGVAWVVCVVGWIAVAIYPNSYEATARVYVDTNTGLAPLLQGLAVQQDVEAQLQMVRQAMLGRPALEKVARETDLHLTADTPEELDDLLTDLQQDISITNVLDSDKNRGGGRDRTLDSLYLISYQYHDRQKAIAVVRQLLNTFVEDTLGGKRAGSETAQKFLEEQVRQYAAKLNDQELQLAEFKKDNMGLVPGASGDYFSRLEAETSKVRQARSDLALALSRSDELRRQLLGQQGAVSGGANQPAPAIPTTETDMRLAEARTRLDELLLRYTDRHPDVMATRETIRQLEERRERELEALRTGEGATSTTLAANPVYQSIQMALNQNDVQVAELRRQIGQGEANISQLRQLATTAPEVEARYSQLTRDFEVTRAQYNSLLQRLEQARLSDEAQQTGVVRFEVIDPPTVGFEPVSPNRPVLVALVLLAGIGAGLGLAYLMHLQRPVFDTTRSLSELTGLPVLGLVSAAWMGDMLAARRKDAAAWGGAVAGLLAAFVIILAAQLLDLGLIRGLVG